MMKNLQIVLFICFIVMGTNEVFCCDVCGGVTSASSNGLLQLIPKHTVGIHYQVAQFHSQRYAYAEKSEELFQTVELTGRWQATKRLQIGTSVPFSIKRSSTDVGELELAGLGDITCIGQYGIVNQRSSRSGKWNHSLWIGLGAKLPTGGFGSKDENNKIINPYLQPGTGTLDALGNIFYAVQQASFGFVVETNVRLTSTNKHNFRFGNQMQSNLRAYYRLPMTKTVQIVPNSGLSLDMKGMDSEFGQKEPVSGGWFYLSSVGLDLLTKRFMVSLQGQIPIAGQQSEKLLVVRPRYRISANYFLGSVTSK